MKKCKACGDFINSSYETCNDCNNLSKEQLQNKIKNEENISNNVKKSKKKSKKKYYEIFNLVLLPLAFCFIFSSETITNLESIPLVLTNGLGAFGLLYYPQKLIMFLINGLMKKKWNWPIGYAYFIFPTIIFIYFNYYNYI